MTLPQNIFNVIFPVGYIYQTTGESPQSIFDSLGISSKWEKLEGRFLLGSSSSHELSSTGGEETHTLNINEVPSHAHNRGNMEIFGGLTYFGSSYSNGSFIQSKDGAFNYYSLNNVGNDSWSQESRDSSRWVLDFYASRSWTGETNYVGGGGSHNNMPPYYVVNIWRRTS